MPTNTSFIPNQPVSFGPDANTMPCNCNAEGGKAYLQPVQYGDVTRLQLPNIAQREVGDYLNTNEDFAGALTGWSQGTSDDELVEVWTEAGGVASAGAGSKILLQALVLDARHRYRISVDIDALHVDDELVIVGFVSYDAIDSTDYDEITRFDSTGVKFYDLTGYDYVAFGCMVVGTGVTDCSINYFGVQLWETVSPPELHITDADGATVVSGIEPVETYDTRLIYEIDWSVIDGGDPLPEGCYRICTPIASGAEFGDNLITAANYGTFEEDSTGISTQVAAALEASRINSQQYSGSYAYQVEYSSGPVLAPVIYNIFIHDEPIILKPETRYTMRLKLFISDGFVQDFDEVQWDHGLPAGIEWIDGFQGIAGTYDEWIDFRVTFITGTALGERTLTPKITFSIIGNDSPAAGVFIFDQFTLIEHEMQCSQAFKLYNYLDCSLKFVYSNEDDSFGFIDTETYPFELRLADSNISQPYFPEEIEDYEDSAGSTSIAYASSSQVSKLNVNKVPLYIHQALRLALLFDSFTINGIRHVKIPGDYNINWHDKTMLGSVNLEIKEAVQLTRNLNL